MSKYWALACIGVIFFFSECKRSKVASVLPPVDTTGSYELAKFKINEIDFVYFHFKSKVEYTSAGENQNFTVNGRIKKDSIIWLSITPGLGIEAARCLILKDSVWVLDRIHNKSYSYDFSYINKTFNTNLTFENLQSVLVGNLAFSKKSTDKLVKQQELGFFLLRQLRNSIKMDNYVSTASLKIETLELLNTEDNSSLSIKYSEFAPLDSFLFANKVKALVKYSDAQGGEKNTVIDIHHTKAEIVTKPLNFPFNVPKRFEDK